jgi:hemolysin III
MAGAIIHIIEFALNISAMVLLIVFAVMKENPKQIVSSALYGAFHIFFTIFSLLYTTVLLYNSKNIINLFEIGSKYLVFAGIAIPINLVVGGSLGWIFLGIFILLKSFGNNNKYDLRRVNKNTYFFINLALLIAFAVMLSLSWSQFNIGLLMWLGLAFLAAPIGLVFHRLTFHYLSPGNK